VLIKNKDNLPFTSFSHFSRNGIENLSVVFTKPDKRTSWEESFSEAKQKLGEYAVDLYSLIMKLALQSDKSVYDFKEYWIFSFLICFYSVCEINT
jgi:hypothetical protein